MYLFNANPFPSDSQFSFSPFASRFVSISAFIINVCDREVIQNWEGRVFELILTNITSHFQIFREKVDLQWLAIG